MKNYMEYKGYRGTISYCSEDRILYGKVLGTKDSISYEGESVSELESDFHAAVDDYLEVCNRKVPPVKNSKVLSMSVSRPSCIAPPTSMRMRMDSR